MDQKIIDFLTKERVCGLTLVLPDGTPHSSAMHFWITKDPFNIYFLTKNTSKKFGKVQSEGKTQASIVSGFDEDAMVEYQATGEVSVVSDKIEFEKQKALDVVKNLHHEKFYSDPSVVILKFTPSWWRYTEFKSQPKLILSSDKQ